MKASAAAKKELKRIKKNIENSYDGFLPNAERYAKQRKFIFMDSMSDGEKAVNNELQRNSLQVNMLEAYLNRVLGEYMKNQPELVVSASDDYHAKTPEEHHEKQREIDIVTGHLRWIFDEARKIGTEYNIIRDILSGGYSSAKIFTEYSHAFSFHQDLKFARTYDQTLVGFDMLATDPDKSDGDYCFEIVPYRREDFQKEFKKIDISSLSFVNNTTSSSPNLLSIGSFTWSYRVGDDDIILVADYYEKKKTNATLVQLSDMRTMLLSEYEELLNKWEESQQIDLPPIITNRRETMVTTIERYRIIENDVIDHTETNYTDLPIKFIDGNSVINKDVNSGACSQNTRSMFYHCEGAQKALNFAMQSLCNEIENMRPPTIIASLDGIPKGDEYINAYRNPQNTSVLIYEAFKDGDPAVPLAPPMFAPRPPIPPEILQTIEMASAMIPNIIGSHDAGLTQMTDNELSGKAITEIQSMSNASANPFQTNYLLGQQSIGQMLIDMMPLYYKTERTLPIIDSKGKASAISLNGEGGMKFKYRPGDLKLKVQPGVSFTQQQTRSLQFITAIANSMPGFGNFANTKALDLLIDSFPDIKNREEWQARGTEWMQEQAQAEAQAREAESQQPSIESQAMQIASQQVQAEHQVGMAKVQQQAQAEQMKASLKMEEIQIDNEKLKVEIAKIVAQMHIEEQKLGIQQQRADDERVNTVLDAAIKTSEHHHDKSEKAVRRDMEMLKMAREHEGKLAREVERHEKRELEDE